MPSARNISSQYPMHIYARSNNKERFPCPLEVVWEIVSDYLFLLKKGFDLSIHSFLLMPNHFHMIASDPNGNVSDAMEYFMRETSREIGRNSGRINKIWGGPYRSTVIDTLLYYYHAYKYVYRNPVEAGLCEHPLLYDYSTLPFLLGRRNSIIPVEEDLTLFSDVEGTLAWLSEPYSEKENSLIKAALAKKTFKLRKDPATRRPSILNSWESVPNRFVLTR